MEEEQQQSQDQGAGCFLFIVVIVLSWHIYSLNSKIDSVQAELDKAEYDIGFYEDKLENISEMASSRNYNYNQVLDDIENEARH